MKMKENTTVSCIFYPSLVLSVRYSVQGKKRLNSDVIKEVTSKGRDSLHNSRLTSSLLRNVLSGEL